MWGKARKKISSKKKKKSQHLLSRVILKAHIYYMLQLCALGILSKTVLYPLLYLDLQAEIQPHFNKKKMSSGYACLIIWIIAITTLSWVSALTSCQPFPAVQQDLGLSVSCNILKKSCREESCCVVSGHACDQQWCPIKFSLWPISAFYLMTVSAGLRGGLWYLAVSFHQEIKFSTNPTASPRPEHPA